MRVPWLLSLLAVLLVAPDVAALQPTGRPDRSDTPSSQRPRRPRAKKRRRPARQPAQQEAKPTPAEDLDRTVVRWHARGTGGVAKPRFITARELAFEARLEALASSGSPSTPYTSKDIRAALQRHISETMLATLPVSVKPTPKQVASYAESAREILAQRIASQLEDPSVDARRAYGIAKLDAARRAEGISREELDALLRRRARASWYLDKMVAPMLKPSELDLREAHLRGETPFTPQPFEEAKDAIERWYISARLTAALERYFRNVRSRVYVVVISRPPRARNSRTESADDGATTKRDPRLQRARARARAQALRTRSRSALKKHRVLRRDRQRRSTRRSRL